MNEREGHVHIECSAAAVPSHFYLLQSSHSTCPTGSVEGKYAAECQDPAPDFSKARWGSGSHSNVPL
jgi:hypothetical protein